MGGKRRRRRAERKKEAAAGIIEQEQQQGRKTRPTSRKNNNKQAKEKKNDEIEKQTNSTAKNRKRTTNLGPRLSTSVFTFIAPRVFLKVGFKAQVFLGKFVKGITVKISSKVCCHLCKNSLSLSFIFCVVVLKAFPPFFFLFPLNL